MSVTWYKGQQWYKDDICPVCHEKGIVSNFEKFKEQNEQYKEEYEKGVLFCDCGWSTDL